MPFGKVILITPTHTKHKWEKHELHLRSLLCAEDGTIISSGLSKFFNYLENAEGDALTCEAITSGRAIYTEKIDGSLLIRFVYDGVVYFRTRGSHTLGDGFDNIPEFVSKNYPALMNPLLYSGYSILMEYVSPETTIILNYPEQQIKVLGYVAHYHDDGIPQFYGDSIALDSLCDDFNISSVKIYEFDSTFPDEVVKIISSWKDVEGIVLRYKTGFNIHLAKIKTTEYIRMHSFRFHFTKEKIKTFCYINEITNIEEYKNCIYKLGFDWEIAEFSIPYVEEYISELLKNKESVSKFINTISELKFSSRKDAAIALKELTKENIGFFNIGIQYLFGDKAYIDSAIIAMTLGVGINSLKELKLNSSKMINFSIKDTESKIDAV